MRIRIRPDALKAIQGEVAARDRAAFMLGVALAEYEINKTELGQSARPEGQKLLRLGALQHEFDTVKATFMGSIHKHLDGRREIAERSLAELGLDIPSRTFTIDETTGDVLELLNGNYVPMETP